MLSLDHETRDPFGGIYVPPRPRVNGGGLALRMECWSTGVMGLFEGTLVLVPRPRFCWVFEDDDENEDDYDGVSVGACAKSSCGT
jgi:hypothetical protein